jgi:hypothetical protein
VNGHQVSVVTDGISTNSLEGVSVAVDARVVLRPGIGFSSYLRDVVQHLLELGGQVLYSSTSRQRNTKDSFDRLSGLVLEAAESDLGPVRPPKAVTQEQFKLYWAPTNNGIPFLPIKTTWTISTTHDLVPWVKAGT